MSLNSHWINTLIIECLIIFLFFNISVCIFTCIFGSFVKKEKKYVPLPRIEENGEYY